MGHQKIPWPGGPSIKQKFSLPSSIIYYISKNPSSPEVYNKLIQSCKYFFEENPILIVQRLEHFYGDGDEMSICSKKYHDDDNCCVSINLKRISSRFWLTGGCLLDENNMSNTSTLCSKLFRSDIIHLSLYEKTVMFEDFKLLINSVIHFSLGDAKILNNNGSVVNLERIIESIPNIKEFHHVNFYNENGIYKIEELSNFIKNHKNLPFTLNVFPHYVSDEYKAELDALIDTIIESGVPNRMIEYSGQDDEKYNILKNRFTYKDDDEENIDENANGAAQVYEDDDDYDSEDEDNFDSEDEDD